MDIISNEYDYFNINCDSKNKVYANKQLETTTDKGKTIKSIGIISYDLATKEEKVVLEGKEGNDKRLESSIQHLSYLNPLDQDLMLRGYQVMIDTCTYGISLMLVRCQLI